tara:strand:- start:1 stop:456 length:456 start_codon:yes stop_codon:yes gene_type:complete
MSYTFDCATKIIQLDTIDTLLMGDLYSRWKDVVISDQVIAGCEQAFRVVKEPLQGTTFVGPYYFLMNDWQIRPYDNPHELVVDGTLVQDQTSTLQSFKLDNLTSVVSIVREIAVSVQVVETNVSGLTSQESIDLALINQVKNDTSLIPATL